MLLKINNLTDKDMLSAVSLSVSTVTLKVDL